VGQRENAELSGAAWEESTLARAYRRRRTETDETEEDENRTGRRRSQSKMKMFCLEMLFFSWQ
jgi:hypothetical protein